MAKKEVVIEPTKKRTRKPHSGDGQGISDDHKNDGGSDGAQEVKSAAENNHSSVEAVAPRKPEVDHAVESAQPKHTQRTESAPETATPTATPTAVPVPAAVGQTATPSQPSTVAVSQSSAPQQQQQQPRREFRKFNNGGGGHSNQNNHRHNNQNNNNKIKER